MNNLDAHDLKILELLQANGRLTNQELSDLVGLSASQCSRRRINLEQAQLILGYHARLAPQAMGLGVVGLVEVSLVNHTQDYAEAFRSMLAAESAIVDAYKTTGDSDYLLKVAVADLDGLSRLINQISMHKSTAHVKTSVVLERLKENGLVSDSPAQ
ncbi:MAG: Lrp/AsnC family transcriptional regulator [Acidihalobacter sp.]|jgi:DNA-binding Lrp family transcriptional regulator|uniref:Lrp/AsnC family transcriptional regulator n=1 Tax=Acidihalobacter sp. TaxID=1872108 RepID=UPI00307F6D95